MLFTAGGRPLHIFTMHRCLQVPEIVTHFAEHLLTDDRCRKQWLVCMALTCRTFYEPAMDILWRELGDFSPLLRCFPDDVMKEYYYEPDSSSLAWWNPYPMCQWV